MPSLKTDNGETILEVPFLEPGQENPEDIYTLKFKTGATSGGLLRDGACILPFKTAYPHCPPSTHPFPPLTPAQLIQVMQELVVEAVEIVDGNIWIWFVGDMEMPGVHGDLVNLVLTP